MDFSRADFLKDTPIYGMTAEAFSHSGDNIYDVDKMLESGIKVIQYREKEKCGMDMYRQCVKIREMTADAGAVLIIDDFTDLALAVGADGVHIGQEDMPIEAVRSIVPEDFIIGLSTHSPRQAKDAIQRGADYIGVGPVFETHTKKNVCDPVGLEYLDYVVKNTDIPFVAIGGIKEHNIAEVYAHGAKCVCLVTEIVGSENIPEKVHRILQHKSF